METFQDSALRDDVKRAVAELGFTTEIIPSHISVKEAVLPFAKFPGTDTILGPEMRSTGEVMGIDSDFATAFAKSQTAAGANLPSSGKIFISMAASAKEKMVEPGKRLLAMGYTIVCTSGTAKTFRDAGVEVEVVKKLQEGRPNLLDLMANQEISLIFNTPSGKGARTDEGRIRAASVAYRIPCVTTLPGSIAVVDALEALAKNPEPQVKSIQEWT